MAQLWRPGLPAGQKAELWRRWKNGQSLSDIGRALGKHAGSVHGVVSSNGGIAPAARSRSRLALSLAEREEISRGMAVSASMRQIAIMIGRVPSTVSREISRNGGQSKYRASEADSQAWDQARRPKQCRLGMNDGWLPSFVLPRRKRISHVTAESRRSKYGAASAENR